MASTRNIRLDLEFDGSGFHGWQQQPRHPSIQQAVEAALESVLNEQVTVYGCGRTDAGVSARDYVANFHTGSRLMPGRIRMALNARLPETVTARSAREVAPSFHARFSARGKTYVYRVVLSRSPLRRHHAWELFAPVDVDRVSRAARLFLGTSDFRPFCQTRDRDGICTLNSVDVRRAGDEIAFVVTGDRFLYKMVRRIVGALVAVGTGRLTEADIRAALAGRPHVPYTTAPACGLVLDSVFYSDDDPACSV